MNTRREILALSMASLTSPTTGTGNVGREYRGRFNFKTMDFYPFNQDQVQGGKCFVDGKEIKTVWFADTEMGVVRTYDVMGDGTLASGHGHSRDEFVGREVHCSEHEALSETLRGHVQIFGALK